MEPPPDRDQLPRSPSPARGCGRAAPPLASSAASRRLHSPPASGVSGSLCRPPGWAALVRSPSSTSPPIPRSASQPRGSATRVAAHRSGAFSRSCSQPPTPRSGCCGRRLPGGALPEARSEPAGPSSRIRLARRRGGYPPAGRPSRGPAAVSGLSPRRRKRGYPRPRGPRPTPPLEGGPRFAAGQVGWAGG